MTITVYKGVVLAGDKTGRTIGFPTINLDVTILPSDLRTGIYASVVRFGDKQYRGALYFGPRLIKGEEQNVLEIHLLDFDEDVYDKEIEFEMHDHIRDIKNFDTFEELQEEIVSDIQKVRLALSSI